MILEPPGRHSFSGLAEERKAVISRYSNDLIYLAECNVGLGVFAKQDMPPGQMILTFGGPLIDFAETKRRGSWECMPLQIGFDLYFAG